MSQADLRNFQEKFGLNDTFMLNIANLFDKLVDFGYISIFKKKKLIDKLYENVNEVIIGSKNSLDYKSGFYDANKKVLYIKDEKDVKAIYLRVLYAITTEEVDSSTQTTGYMITRLRSDSYKLEHINFGINRAVMSNLACKLCNALPTDISLHSSYKSYSHNFLGYTIEADNTIYALEGKLLSELCFALNIDEQLFYTGIFAKEPYKYLEALLKKKGVELDTEFFKLFDDTSRNYNTYNKLNTLAKKLNNNYLEFKKHVLDENTDELIAEKDNIEKHIKNVILNITVGDSDRFSLSNEGENSEEFPALDTSLNEHLFRLENLLKTNLIKMQTILCDKIIGVTAYLTDYQYASRLKQFSTMLIIENEILNKKITDTIIHKLLPKDEITSVNLTMKIKYMLIQNILSESQYTAISKVFSFNIIPELIDETNGTVLALLNINGNFARLVQINDLHLPLEKMNAKPAFIPLDNFAYLLNSDYSNMYVGFLEKIYTALRFKFQEFKNLKLTELYMFEYNTRKYLIVTLHNNAYVLTVDINKNNYDFKMQTISESYSLFGKSTIKLPANKNSLLPTITNK